MLFLRFPKVKLGSTQFKSNCFLFDTMFVCTIRAKAKVGAMALIVPCTWGGVDHLFHLRYPYTWCQSHLSLTESLTAYELSDQDLRSRNKKECPESPNKGGMGRGKTEKQCARALLELHVQHSA